MPLSQPVRPGLRTDRRHRRVRHAGRRRQGQGPQGGRRTGHRLRRRRARLPDPGPHRRGRRRGLPRPGDAPLHARPPASPSSARRSPPRPSGTPASTSRARQVLVTNGGKHAVYNAFQTLLDPGDEVLLPAPYWTTYPEAIALTGARHRRGPHRRDHRLPGHRRPARGRHAPTARRRSSSCRPSNPTGAVYPPERGRGHRPVGARARHLGDHRRDLRAPHLRRAPVHLDRPRSCPSSLDRCVILNGVAKTYAMTGWRVGWLIGPPDVVKAAINLQSHSTSNVSNVAQTAALAAVAGPLDAVVEMRAAFERRAGIAHRILTGIDGVTCIEPEGAFYAYPNLTGLLGRPIAGRKAAKSTAELAELLLDEVKVAIVPGEAFGTPGYARLSFALGDDDLGEGLTRIADAVADGCRDAAPYSPPRSPLPSSPGAATTAVAATSADSDDHHHDRRRRDHDHRRSRARRGALPGARRRAVRRHRQLDLPSGAARRPVPRPPHDRRRSRRHHHGRRAAARHRAGVRLLLRLPDDVDRRGREQRSRARRLRDRHRAGAGRPVRVGVQGLRARVPLDHPRRARRRRFRDRAAARSPTATCSTPGAPTSTSWARAAASSSSATPRAPVTSRRLLAEDVGERDDVRGSDRLGRPARRTASPKVPFRASRPARRPTSPAASSPSPRSPPTSPPADGSLFGRTRER